MRRTEANCPMSLLDLWWSSCGLVASVDLICLLPSIPELDTLPVGLSMMINVWLVLQVMLPPLWIILMWCRFMTNHQISVFHCMPMQILEAHLTCVQLKDIFLPWKDIGPLPCCFGAKSDSGQFRDPLLKLNWFLYQHHFFTEGIPLLKMCQQLITPEIVLSCYEDNKAVLAIIARGLFQVTAFEHIS